MQNSNNMIFFNFSYFALRLLGKGLYSNHWTAISELVANGLDARANNVKIYINMKDKKHSVIEIFDNGCGMDYKDLIEKYVLIGRDKRDDKEVDEEIKEQFMGRKGIGKLAALYLSNKYYLITRTRIDESAWCLDASNVRDSDIPHLDRMQTSDISIEAKEEWDKFKTGTMIRLTNVDLTNFGEKTLAAFKARLADFYLVDELKGKIEVATLTSNENKIIFEEVKKSIAFKNMCAFYNNTNIDFLDKLGKTVIFKSSVESIKHLPIAVNIVNPDSFTVKGRKRFLKSNGEYTENELDYEMKGWIGVHTSISKEEALLNDSEYLKNKAYRPNQLRLYVRKKLAVENFLEYVKNTQAFSNYIEGEISFDILDNNELGDIATSNRQGFVADDERIILLIEILKPIIGYLIRSRVNMGHQVKSVENEYYTRLKKEKELEKMEREEAEKAKQLAELDKEKAQKCRDEAEERASLLNDKLEIIAKDLGIEKKRNYFLVDTLSEDQINYAKRLHMIKINVGTIENVVTKSIMKIQRNRFQVEDAWDSLKTISYSTGRIKAVLKYGAIAQFDTKEESTTGDLFQYIYEYVENILINYENIDIKVFIENDIKYIRKFSMQDMAVILENIVSNSLKNNANLININMYKTEKEYAIDFIDNGDGLKDKNIDVDELFQFGKSYTNTGTGVGLYHICEIIGEMGGNILIDEKIKNGFGLKVRYEI